MLQLAAQQVQDAETRAMKSQATLEAIRESNAAAHQTGQQADANQSRRLAVAEHTAAEQHQIALSLQRDFQATLQATLLQNESELKMKYQHIMQQKEGELESNERRYLEVERARQEAEAQSHAAALQAELANTQQQALDDKEQADTDIARLTAIITGYNASSPDGGDQIMPDHLIGTGRGQDVYIFGSGDLVDRPNPFSPRRAKCAHCNAAFSDESHVVPCRECQVSLHSKCLRPHWADNILQHA